MRFFARPQAELINFKGFLQSVVTFLQAANHSPRLSAAVQCVQSNFSAGRLMWRLTSGDYGSEFMEPVGYIRCLQNLLLLFFTFINGTRWVTTGLVKSAVTFHNTFIDWGYIRCLQNLLLLFFTFYQWTRWVTNGVFKKLLLLFTKGEHIGFWPAASQTVSPNFGLYCSNFGVFGFAFLYAFLFAFDAWIFE